MRVPIATTTIFLGCLFGGLPVEDFAPGPQELHKLYGEPTMERFVVHSDITLTAQYGRDGKACQILVAPKQSLVELHGSTPPMSSQDVSAILQVLLPDAATGKQIDSSTAQVSSAKTLLKTDYENLSVKRICSSPSCVSSNENHDLRTVVVFK